MSGFSCGPYLSCFLEKARIETKFWNNGANLVAFELFHGYRSLMTNNPSLHS